MFEIIFIILLLGSLIGMGIMMFIKIPVLIELTLEDQGGLFKGFGKRIKLRGILGFFSKEKILHKLLSKIRINL